MTECGHPECSKSADVVFSYDVERKSDKRDYHKLCYAHMEEMWCTPLTIPEVQNTVQEHQGNG